MKAQDKKWLLKAVAQDCYVLGRVRNQTPELCMAAVKQNGWALCFVKSALRDEVILRLSEQGYVPELNDELHVVAMWPVKRRRVCRN